MEAKAYILFIIMNRKYNKQQNYEKGKKSYCTAVLNDVQPPNETLTIMKGLIIKIIIIKITIS
jgi:hypothetical protein